MPLLQVLWHLDLCAPDIIHKHKIFQEWNSAMQSEARRMDFRGIDVSLFPVFPGFSLNLDQIEEKSFAKFGIFFMVFSSDLENPAHLYTCAWAASG